MGFQKEVIGKVNLTSDGMPLSEEFKIEAFKRGLRAVEIPVPFMPELEKSNLIHGKMEYGIFGF